ncbi:hypothetical protein BDA99DRAFT_571586 [Phascolomyces articulosus]|uniref:Secreted protein n=1 Tax=Phascolomyces articulosus TaxID=60185 RepID=A0AAD5KAT8_9FUNG|nr:hypothetical protein BDA99DRAFT_571586 [Phascolomyces articulosus]
MLFLWIGLVLSRVRFLGFCGSGEAESGWNLTGLWIPPDGSGGWDVFSMVVDSFRDMMIKRNSKKEKKDGPIDTSFFMPSSVAWGIYGPEGSGQTWPRTCALDL